MRVAAASSTGSKLPLGLRRASRERSVVIGGAIVLLILIMALIGPLIAPYDQEKTSLLNSWAAPSAEHLLGADKLGRDVLSRLLVGAQVSMIVALIVVTITLVVGIIVGMLAAYLGGRLDGVLMRIVDIGLAFPDIIIAILVASALGPGIATVIIALSFSLWPGTARLTRSLVLVIRQEMYLDSAVVSGTPVYLIFWRHLLPNILAPSIVRASAGIGYVIMAEATLSFLGLGIQEPLPSWGGMIRDGLPVLRTDPHLALTGCAVLALAVVGFNLLGDGLRDVLDPRLKRE